MVRAGPAGAATQERPCSLPCRISCRGEDPAQAAGRLARPEPVGGLRPSWQRRQAGRFGAPTAARLRAGIAARRRPATAGGAVKPAAGCRKTAQQQDPPPKAPAGGLSRMGPASFAQAPAAASWRPICAVRRRRARKGTPRRRLRGRRRRVPPPAGDPAGQDMGRTSGRGNGAPPRRCGTQTARIGPQGGTRQPATLRRRRENQPSRPCTRCQPLAT